MPTVESRLCDHERPWKDDWSLNAVVWSNIKPTSEPTSWPTSPAPHPGMSWPFWVEVPTSFPRSRWSPWCRRPATHRLHKHQQMPVTQFSWSRICCLRQILHFGLQVGKSAILGTRNFSLRCRSWSCLSRYEATSAEVGLTPNKVDTRSTVSLGVKPTNWSITVQVEDGTCVLITSVSLLVSFLLVCGKLNNSVHLFGSFLITKVPLGPCVSSSSGK